MLEKSTEYHVTIYLGGHPLAGRLFKVMATGNDEAKKLAMKEAQKTLLGGVSDEVKTVGEELLAKSFLVVGMPGQGCACAECYKPFSRILAEGLLEKLNGPKSRR